MQHENISSMSLKVEKRYIDVLKEINSSCNLSLIKIILS